MRERNNAHKEENNEYPLHHLSSFFQLIIINSSPETKWNTYLSVCTVAPSIPFYSLITCKVLFALTISSFGHNLGLEDTAQKRTINKIREHFDSLLGRVSSIR